jgi:UDP-glucose 4-epimerase
MSGKLILVTGGAGFIGTHLCRALLSRGYQTRVLDLSAPKERVAGVDYVKGDVGDPAAIAASLKGVSAVYHLAATASVTLCEENPGVSYRNNVLTVCQLLDGIRAAQSQGKPIRIVFASSAAVYGHQGNAGVALSEMKNPPSPKSHYGMQKWLGEELLRHYHRSFSLETVSFRFFNVFGPGQDPSSPYSGVISVFASRVRAHAPLRLDGGGTQRRDFVSVFDVVKGCIGALALAPADCDGAPINLASGRAVTIRELANAMIDVSGAKVALVNGPAREADIRFSLADVTRFKKVMGWVPDSDFRARLAELMQTIPYPKAA